jgi:catechol 2,3-dioxygenase-like lactoylglutathione lyase family enzyme
MEVLINKLINEFEKGKLSRRLLIETLAVTAMTIYSADSAVASEAIAAAGVPEPDRVHLDTLIVNHISYVIGGPSPDYRKARDFYSDLMGMHVVNDRPDATNPQYGQCNLAFYAKDETPMGQPKGTPSPFIIARCYNPQAQRGGNRGNANAGATGQAAQGQRGGQQQQQQSQVQIDHIAYTIADWDARKVLEELKRRGLHQNGMPEPQVDTPNSFHVVDPHGYDLQISGIEMNALH